jgi:hypothetical protein
MSIKLTIVLFNTRGPWHWSCQHIAAVVTDIETGKTFNIEYGAGGKQFHRKEKLTDTDGYKNCYVNLCNDKQLYYYDYDGKQAVVAIQDFKKFEDDLNKIGKYDYYSADEIEKLIISNGGQPPEGYPLIARTNPAKDHLNRWMSNEKSCCIGDVSLYSDKDFDIFLELMRSKYSDASAYRFCSNNCADAVSFAIDELCPEKACTDVACSIYKLVCCPLFFGSLGLSLFPTPPLTCTSPQDIYDKARWLAKVTSYGAEIKATPKDEKVSVKESKDELQKPLLSA